MRPQIMMTIALTSGLLVSCNQKQKTADESPEERQGAARTAIPEKQTPEKQTPEKAEAKKNVEPKPFETGSSLAYLPKSCEISRMYFNARMLKNYGATAARLAPMLGSALARVPEARQTVSAALKGLHANGIDLANDVHELAGCVEAEDQWIGVLAVDLSEVQGNPLELMKKAAAKEIDLELKLKQSDGMSYLAADDAPGALGVIDTRTLGYASSPKMLAAAKQRPGDPQALGSDLGHTVLASRFGGGPVESGSLDVSREGNSTVAQLQVTLHPADAKRIKQDRRAYVESFDKWASRHGFDPSNESLEKIAQMPENATFTMEENKVSAKVVLADRNLAGLIVALASMTPDDLVETLPKR